MKYEVEVKYPLRDSRAFRETLSSLAARYVGTIRQEDEYLSHPSRDFAQTDEAFRIRRIGEENRLTFKGPLVDQMTKTREEIELTFAAGGEAAGQMQAMLYKLGFGSVFRVCKNREIYELQTSQRKFEIVIDEVDGLGDYVELECAADEEDQEAARREILELAGQLSLGPEVERRSYLRLLLSKESERT